MTKKADVAPTPPTPALEGHLLPDTDGAPLEVPLNYEIITLFSEGLYQSPHKAVEELVSNSYDAGASTVRVILPRAAEEQGDEADSLFVIDDGTGMDAAGFTTLWKIAESPKAKASGKVNGRLPIGQFGIGKLAAYVLAWRLTHVSKKAGSIYYTTMDFNLVSSHHLNGPNKPLQLRLHKISATKAKEILYEVQERDAQAWEMLFGSSAKPNWTVAALSDFKGLYDELIPGTLRWVLRSGLPITSNFSLSVDGDQLVSPVESKRPLYTAKVGGSVDEKGAEMAGDYPGEVAVQPGGIKIAGIDGLIKGVAKLYEQPLIKAKSGTQYHRSNGFFIRVRGRIINLDDELFGLDAQNHSSWARFALTIDADGLRSHLLSSREGVKASRAMDLLRKYLHGKFNECRSFFENDAREKLRSLDIEKLLKDAPSGLLVDPLLDAVMGEIDSPGESYYIGVPQISDEEREGWIGAFSEKNSREPIRSIKFDDTKGAYDRLARFEAETQELLLNRDHPYMAKLDTHTKNDTPLNMVGTVELITDALLRGFGLRGPMLLEFFERRDRALRVIAGYTEADAKEILRGLSVANDDEVALERAVGRAFELLGMFYEPGGTNAPGDDGYLVTRLGVVKGKSADFTVVYDAKSTDSSRVPADKCDLASLEDFRTSKNADYAFFVGKGFAKEDDPNGKLNRKLEGHGHPATLLKLSALERLVGLQVQYGVPISEVRGLFDQRTTGEVDKWLDELDQGLSQKQVPLHLLLEALHSHKTDQHETPNIKVVRAFNKALMDFSADKLAAVLRGVEAVVGTSWIEVENSYDVVLHDSPAKIIEQFERRMADDGD